MKKKITDWIHEFAILIIGALLYGLSFFYLTAIRGYEDITALLHVICMLLVFAVGVCCRLKQ
jgi:hypothetical protein